MKGVTLAHLGPIWYHLEPSHAPNSQTSFLVGTFLPFLTARRLQEEPIQLFWTIKCGYEGDLVCGLIFSFVVHVWSMQRNQKKRLGQLTTHSQNRLKTVTYLQVNCLRHGRYLSTQSFIASKFSIQVHIVQKR